MIWNSIWTSILISILHVMIVNETLIFPYENEKRIYYQIDLNVAALNQPMKNESESESGKMSENRDEMRMISCLCFPFYDDVWDLI